MHLPFQEPSNLGNYITTQFGRWFQTLWAGNVFFQPLLWMIMHADVPMFQKAWNYQSGNNMGSVIQPLVEKCGFITQFLAHLPDSLSQKGDTINFLQFNWQSHDRWIFGF